MGHSLLRAPASQIVVLTLLVFLGVVGLRSQGILEGLEIEAYDWSLRLRPHQLRWSPSTIKIFKIKRRWLGEHHFCIYNHQMLSPLMVEASGPIDQVNPT